MVKIFTLMSKMGVKIKNLTECKDHKVSKLFTYASFLKFYKNDAMFIFHDSQDKRSKMN